ncbi:Ig-like domain-containing protein [Natronomonas halophila]|uniref:Ig-like domain-containing protein n=1 Tax=Natronomonas halophila TaxID=2747817 RepID=UPI0015B5E66C|nr:Ig-like domain-containing protein [Natronomonas halophila]QLD86976.1 Ig-like domain-containing protein [Natronomonas halophila]
MTFTNDTRGVSEVVGAILVFGVLVALLAIMQTQAVPAANQQVEFEHSQDVQGDFAGFHATASEVANSGDKQSVSIKTGTGYPTRMLFFNPPRVQGSLSTSENQTVTIENATATDPEVDDYLNGSDVKVDTRTLHYNVTYNELQNAPQIRYEYGILYSRFRSGTTVQNPGSVIDDTDINLLFMAGDYSRTAGDTQSVDVRPVSAPARPVTIEGEGNNDITLELPTDLPVSVWQEYYGDQSHVTIQNGTAGTVRITLDGDRRYTLRMAGLGLESGVDKPDAHYIVPAEDAVTDVGAGGNTSVIFEVRDKYNNPVAGEEVEIELDGNTQTVNTSSEGHAVMSVSPSTTGTAVGTIVGCSGGDRCSAEYDVNVLAPGGVINPSGGVRLQDAWINTDIWDDIGNFLNPDDSTGSGVTMEFNASNNLEFEAVRVNYYSPGGGSTPPDEWEMTDGSNTLSGEVSGEFESSNSLDPASNIQVGFVNGGDSYDVTTDDYFVMTVILSNGEQSIYFVSPRDNS